MVHPATTSPGRFLRGILAGPLSGPLAATVVRRDGAMITTSPLALLDRQLARCSAGRAGADGLARLAASGVPTIGCHDPHALARSCHGTADPGRSETVVTTLALLAADDELAALCLLVALRPALLRMTGRLVRGGFDREEAEDRVLTAAWETIATPEATVAPTARRLVARTWSTLRTEMRRDLRRRAVEQPVDDWGSEPADADADPGERVSVLLADARRAGALTRRQATLLYDTRVLDRPVELLSVGTGRSRAALWKEGQRAEQALREFLARDGYVVAEPR
jgi:hypothetical protein